MTLAPNDMVPNIVDDSEQVARTYQKRKKGNPKRIPWQAFCASRYPYEISVDRTSYCDPWSKINPEERRVALLWVATVRKEISEVRVVAAKPPPEHAHIEVVTDSNRFIPSSKSELRDDVERWNEHQELCSKLADLAWADDVPLD